MRFSKKERKFVDRSKHYYWSTEVGEKANHLHIPGVRFLSDFGKKRAKSGLSSAQKIPRAQIST